MDHKTTTQIQINRRLALSIGAGVLCAGFISASTPVGPHEVRLRARLRAEMANGLSRIRVTWLPSAKALTREQRAAAILEILDTPAKEIDTGDKSAAA